jgi:hypothetical protein
MRRRQHDAQAERRGDDTPTHVDGALAARRSGTGLTVNNDQTFLDEIIRKAAIRNEAKGDDPRPLFIGADAGRSLQCCDHLETSRTFSLETSRTFSDLSPASNHPGETLTLDEQTFEVKGKYERVFAPNA